jgi:hypothetical protein
MTKTDKTIIIVLIAWMCASAYGTFRGIEWMMTLNSVILIIVLGVIAYIMHETEGW